MSKITTILVDIDGTLVDTNDDHANAWVTAFAENGYTVAFETVRPLIGMGADQMLPAGCTGRKRFSARQGTDRFVGARF